MRQCHHYTLHTPEADNVMEWLALMRHYGAPTRLLDCTYSFFAAVYFALEDFELEDAEGECAVWALNSDWIAERVGKIAPERYKTLEADSNLEFCDGLTFWTIWGKTCAPACRELRNAIAYCPVPKHRR
jgi:hypothetical protein